MPVNVTPEDFVVDAEIGERAAKDVVEFNAILARLRERRLTEIEISGPLQRSMLAWRIATYQQPVLYRVVMLASGCVANWNGRNLLCAYLAARALMETAAVLLVFERSLEALIKSEDLKGINDLITKSAFATRDAKLIKEHPNAEATNVLKTLDKLGKQGFSGIRQHYEFLSERCHPNSSGHHQFFGIRDPDTNIVRYSEWRELPGNFEQILGGAMMISFVEPCMDRLDKAIIQVSELQHRIAPLVED